MLGESDGALTNRELAARLSVDPGHLHFHVRMLHRAGLIELAETVDSVVESFEARTEYLEDVPVADTALVLNLLARRRGIEAALPPSRVLPKPS